MSTDTALLIQVLLVVLAGLGAAVSGVIYWLSNEEHGGFVFLVLVVITLTIGTSVYDASDLVLSR